MARITLNEVGVFRARFMGFKSCQNPLYVMVRLQFLEHEVRGQLTDYQAQILQILHESANMQILNGLIEGQEFFFKMSVSYQSPNTRDGRDYPGGIKFRIIQVLQNKN